MNTCAKLNIYLSDTHFYPLFVFTMYVPNLGYACINTEIQDAPNVKKADRVFVNKSCVAKTFREKGVDYVVGLVRSNLAAVMKVLEWNMTHGIKLYRLSSDMFPHITNPEFGNGSYAYSLEQFDDQLQMIGEYARETGQRLTFHPGQFNQVGAKNPLVFEKTMLDLVFHAEILDRMGMSQDSVMVVHGGGSYGDKNETMKRWAKQFYDLPECVQNRLVIENCERQYNYQDMLYLSDKIHRPVVFDTHHHSCYDILVKKQPDPSTFMDQILATWDKAGVKPKFHISEQAPDKRVGAHSDFVENIPKYLFDVCKKRPIDIMIEAKKKEQAVMKLYFKYFDYNFDTGCFCEKE